MPKKGLNIYKRKDGRWEGRYIKGRKDDGRAEYVYIYGNTYNEVRRKLMQLAVMPLVPQSDKLLTFSDVAIRWLFNISFRVKTSTHAHYDCIVVRVFIG